VLVCSVCLLAAVSGGRICIFRIHTTYYNVISYIMYFLFRVDGHKKIKRYDKVEAQLCRIV
jgi:hypothetical protein